MTTTLGILVNTALFIFLGMVLARLGKRLSAFSHKEVIYAIYGHHMGFLADIPITFLCLPLSWL